MSDEELIGLARQLVGEVNAFFSGDPDARQRIRAVLDPEVKVTGPGAEMFGGLVSGADEAEAMGDEMLDAWERFEIDVQAIDVVDGVVVWESVTRGRSRGAGVPYESPSPRFTAVRFRDGKLLHWDVFESREDALARAREEDPA